MLTPLSDEPFRAAINLADAYEAWLPLTRAEPDISTRSCLSVRQPAHATRDIDLTWVAQQRPDGPVLLEALKALDDTFVVNQERSFQACNRDGREVEPARRATAVNAAGKSRMHDSTVPRNANNASRRQSTTSTTRS